MRKILFITPYSTGLAGSQRFRFEHYLDDLQDHGIKYKLVPFIDAASYKIMYTKGNWPLKIWAAIKGFTRRLYSLFLVPFYDLVFIHREGSPLGYPVVEYIISKVLRKQYIYDFDDAIWKLDITESNKVLSRLRHSENKTRDIVSLAGKVLAGNEYLAGFASKYCHNVKVFPTIVDTEYHSRKLLDKKDISMICIGWTGTHTTLRHFEMIMPVLKKLYENYPDRIYFKLIVNDDVEYPEINLNSTRWNKEQEIEELSELDIGLMPLPDNEWSKGKCGFKAIQYMALGIATIASPVGVNSKIIDHNTNGLLAIDNAHFYEALVELITNDDLRHQLGANGREKIKGHFSKISQKEQFLNLLTS